MNAPDAVQAMYERAPLMRFSPYTYGQVRAVVDLGEELLSLLDRSMQGATVDGRGFLRAYNLFWLWVLGSYEVSRTMCQAKGCFSEAFGRDIYEFKKRVSLLRVPFAKQELPGQGKLILGEASVQGMDTENKDIHFAVEGEVLSARAFVAHFKRIAESVEPRDVIKSIYGQEYSAEG